MKKMVFMSILCMSLSTDAMNPNKNTGDQNSQNLQEIKKDGESEPKNLQIDEVCKLTSEAERMLRNEEEESDADYNISGDDELDADGTISIDADFFNNDDNKLSASGTPSADYATLNEGVNKDPKSEAKGSERSGNVVVLTPKNSDIGGKILRSNSNPPPPPLVSSIGDSDNTQEIRRSDSNPYIPPHLRSGSSSESDHSDHYQLPQTEKHFWPGYSPKEAKKLGKQLSDALNNSSDSSNSSAIGSPGGFNKPRYKRNSNSNKIKIELGGKCNNNNSSNSSASGSPRGLNKPRWSNKNCKSRHSDQDLTQRYGELPSKNKDTAYIINSRPSSNVVKTFSSGRISSSSSGLTPPPPPAQINPNKTNPNVKEPVKSTVIIIEKKKKETSSSSSDDEK